MQQKVKVFRCHERRYLYHRCGLNDVLVSYIAVYTEGQIEQWRPLVTEFGAFVLSLIIS